MRFALEAAGVGIWDMDPATEVVEWSETLESQYGLQPGTFGGTFEAFVASIHPDDRMSVLETVGKVMRSDDVDLVPLERGLVPVVLDADSEPVVRRDWLARPSRGTSYA